MSADVFFPERLTWIRKKRKLSKSALAQKVGVDLRSISAYEAGEFEPAPETTRRLSSALNIDPDYFSLGSMNGPEPEQASFRSLSKMSASKRDVALANGAIAFQIADFFEEKFNLPLCDLPSLGSECGPEEAAYELRNRWGLGEQPILNMVHLLESKGVRVFSLSIDAVEVDAFCTWNDETPFIFLNTKKSAARSRFDAAHELGHVVLHRHGDYRGRVTEKEADEFAAAFLMPRNGFTATAPRFADLKTVIKSKAKWGVSVSAYVKRLHDLGLISDWHYRTLFQQISTRGYRKTEPQDAKRESSKLFLLLLDELRRDAKGVPEISFELGLPQEDIAELLFDLAIFRIEGGKAGNAQGTPKNSSLKLVIDNS